MILGDCDVSSTSRDIVLFHLDEPPKRSCLEPGRNIDLEKAFSEWFPIFGLEKIVNDWAAIHSADVGAVSSELQDTGQHLGEFVQGSAAKAGALL